MSTPMRPLRVAQRDAIWHRYPAMTSGVFHFIAEDGSSPVCGGIALLMSEDAVSPISVLLRWPENRRCKRKACAKLWAEAAQAQKKEV